MIAIADSGTAWLKISFNWGSLMPTAPNPFTRDRMWEMLNANPEIVGPRGLDDQIRTANNEYGRIGRVLAVALTIQDDFPLWTSNAHPEWDRLYSGTNSTRWPPKDKVPDAVEPDTPYGWLVAYLFARYRVFGVYNPNGPSAVAPFGNPRSAWINCLEVCNEPNLKMWPQRVPNSDDYMLCKVTQMIKTADVHAKTFGNGSFVIGPGVADGPTVSNAFTTHYRDFTQGVVNLLANYVPQSALLWSHHNYTDIANQNRTRFEFVVNVLDTSANPYRFAPVVISEGGYSMKADSQYERDQMSELMRVGWINFSASPRVYTYAQWLLNDGPVFDPNFQSGLRVTDGAYPNATFWPRPAFARWYSLPGKVTF
jgi:hypothetical protein